MTRTVGPTRRLRMSSATHQQKDTKTCRISLNYPTERQTMKRRTHWRTYHEKADPLSSPCQCKGNHVKTNRDASQRQLRHPHAPRRDEFRRDLHSGRTTDGSSKRRESFSSRREMWGALFYSAEMNLRGTTMRRVLSAGFGCAATSLATQPPPKFGP